MKIYCAIKRSLIKKSPFVIASYGLTCTYIYCTLGILIDGSMDKAEHIFLKQFSYHTPYPSIFTLHRQDCIIWISVYTDNSIKLKLDFPIILHCALWVTRQFIYLNTL